MGEFRMPALGADMEEGTLNEWLVKVGDEVHRGDIVAVVETPKSAVEVECFDTGTIEQLVVAEGQKVPVGTVLARLGEPQREPGGAAPAEAEAAAGRVGAGVAEVAIAAPPEAPAAVPTEAAVPPLAVPATAPVPAPVPPPLPAPEGTPVEPIRVPAAVAAGLPVRERRGALRPRVTPLARRLAAESGIDLASLHGSGLGGTVRAEDVRRAVSAPAVGAGPDGRHPGRGGARGVRSHREVPEPGRGMAPPEPEGPVPQREGAAGHAVPEAAFADRAAEMRRSIAALMTVSNREIPHYHLSLTIDLHRVVDVVRERNRGLEMSERLVPSAYLLAAAARAARAVPELNGHWVDGSFRPAADVDLGLILSLRSGGLLVPVIAHADRLTVADTMAAMRELTRRARAGRLRGSDLAEPSISASNLGDQGVDSVQGVIYPPQVALVGFGAVAERPWAVDGLLGVRPIVTVTLAGDHRATDGATGSRFLKTIDRLLQAPEEL